MISTLEALQSTLAAEHAAVWVFGTLAAQTSRSAEPTLFAALDAAHRTHRTRRDHLVRAVRDLQVEPVASAVAYELPNPAATVAQVRAAALEVTRGCVASHADLVASTFGDQRLWAVEALTEAAVREMAFGGSPETFPGMTELADR